MRPFLRLVAMLCICGISLAAQTPVDAARKLRDEGRFAEATALLRKRVSAAPADLQARRLLAETLAWLKEFDEAAKLYGSIAEVTKLPADRLAHARALMWKRDYPQARRILELLRPSSVKSEAAEELARLDYWSGDLRSAARDYERLRLLGGLSEAGRKDLADIRAGARPIARGLLDARDDDQPYTLFTSEIGYTTFLDPLTLLNFSAGQHFAEADERFTIPFVEAGAKVDFPSVDLLIEGGARVVRFGNDETRVLPSVALSRRIADGMVSLRLDESEILGTRASAGSDVTVSRVRLHYLQSTSPVQARSVGVQTSRYSDQNEGSGADAYFIEPFLTRQWWRLFGGLSASWRDTDESRFRLSSTRAVPAGAAFRLEHEGVYDPYHTPHDLREARLIAGVVLSEPSADFSARVQITGGIARDRAIAFGPEVDSTPAPATFSFFFDREYEPWDAAATLSWRPRIDTDVHLSLRHVSTVFYDSNEISASLVRRF